MITTLAMTSIQQLVVSDPQWLRAVSRQTGWFLRGEGYLGRLSREADPETIEGRGDRGRPQEGTGSVRFVSVP